MSEVTKPEIIHKTFLAGQDWSPYPLHYEPDLNLPSSVHIGMSLKHMNEYHCSKCNFIVDKVMNYCTHCGTKLNWS